MKAHRLRLLELMLGFFVAGSDLITWELTAEDPPAGYRLAVRHALGVIVEYFQDLKVALSREQELEELLIASRSTRYARSGQARSTRYAHSGGR